MPLDRGPVRIDSSVASFGDVSMLRVDIGGKASGITVLDPDYLSFVLPVCWSGDFFINGEPAHPRDIYVGADISCIHVQGGPREVLGLVLLRAPFVETVSALQGVEPTDLTAGDRILTLSTPAGIAPRRRIEGLFKASANLVSRCPPEHLAQEVIAMMMDVFLSADQRKTPTREVIFRPDRIVRLAEEHFMAAEGSPVSLADLCAAAGVSKSTLYAAFHRVCGQSPLSYFHKRRLNRARIQLLESPLQRGAVKRVAIETGFTESGRFASEYRRLFGESPSATLNSST